MSSQNQYWFNAPKGETHKFLIPYLQQLEAVNSNKVVSADLYLKLYANRDLGSRPSRFQAYANPLVRTGKAVWNVSKRIIDTAHEIVAASMPRVQFLTDGGDYTKQKNAKLLIKFGDGIFDQTDFFNIAKDTLLDAEIFGTGVIKILVTDTKQVSVERILPTEIIIDETLGYNQAPKELHQRKEYSRDALLEMFPGKDAKEAIESASIIDTNSNSVYRPDLIEVFESYKLPSAKKPGKHTICIENFTLLEEKYTETDFPFVFLRWQKLPVSFFGQGLSEQLLDTQMEVQQTLYTISKCLRLFAKARWLSEKGNKVAAAHIRSEIGDIIEWTGSKPEILTQQVLTPEIYSYLHDQYAKMFELSGISQAISSATKADGVPSAIGQREVASLQSGRLSLVSRAFADFHVQALKKMIICAKGIAAEEGSYPVRIKGKNALEDLDWADINVDISDFEMQPFATNFLAITPAARLEKIQEFIKAGMIEAREGMRLLDFPDLKAVTSPEEANEENFLKQIERLLEHGEYYSPESFDNLELGIKIYTNHYNQARLQNVPEEKLDLFRRWIESAIVKATPPKPPAAPAAPGAPSQQMPSMPAPAPQGGMPQ